MLSAAVKQQARRIEIERVCVILALAALASFRGIAQSLPQASAAKAAWFTDIASKSSIAYRTNNDFTGRKYFPQPMCGGVAALDFDNDGFMDLFFTNGAMLPELRKTGPEYFNALLRNRGDGTFEDVTAKAGLRGGIEVGQSLKGDDVVRTLNRLKLHRGAPKVVFCGNGSEFTSQAHRQCVR
jgi:hypothetical protein